MCLSHACFFFPLHPSSSSIVYKSAVPHYVQICRRMDLDKGENGVEGTEEREETEEMEKEKERKKTENKNKWSLRPFLTGKIRHTTV